MSPFQENLFSFGNSVFNCDFRILWEVFISDNKLMELVSKIICASCSTMPVIYGKEGASWPFFNLFKFRFDDIQNNRNTIFIIISNDTLMGVGWITTDDSVLFASKLGWMIRSNISINLILFHFHVLLLLLHSHYKSSIGYQLIMTLRLLKWFLPLFLSLSRTLSLYFMMTWSRWLWMTRFFSLSASATLSLWRTSGSSVSSSSLLLRSILRILILSALSVLTSTRLVSHPRTRSKSVNTLRLRWVRLSRRTVVSVL